MLLDLNLPVQNGWETFEAAQPPRIRCLPVIIITARPNQFFPALASGAGALMEKPLDLPKLLRTMRDLLAEPATARLARMAGKPAEFHYLPPQTAGACGQWKQRRMSISVQSFAALPVIPCGEPEVGAAAGPGAMEHHALRVRHQAPGGACRGPSRALGVFEPVRAAGDWGGGRLVPGGDLLVQPASGICAGQ